MSWKTVFLVLGLTLSFQVLCQDDSSGATTTGAASPDSSASDSPSGGGSSASDSPSGGGSSASDSPSGGGSSASDSPSGPGPSSEGSDSSDPPSATGGETTYSSEFYNPDVRGPLNRMPFVMYRNVTQACKKKLKIPEKVTYAQIDQMWECTFSRWFKMIAICQRNPEKQPKKQLKREVEETTISEEEGNGATIDATEQELLDYKYFIFSFYELVAQSVYPSSGMRQSIKELYRGVGGEDGLGMRLDQAVDKMAFEDWLLVHRSKRQVPSFKHPSESFEVPTSKTFKRVRPEVLTCAIRNSPNGPQLLAFSTPIGKCLWLMMLTALLSELW